MGAQKNHPIKTVLLSTHNQGFTGRNILRLIRINHYVGPVTSPYLGLRPVDADVFVVPFIKITNSKVIS